MDSIGGLVEDDFDPAGRRGPAGEGEHVRGRVEAFDVEPAPAQLEQRLAVAAAELERGLAAGRDERRVGLRVGDRRAQRGVELGDEPRVEAGTASAGRGEELGDLDGVEGGALAQVVAGQEQGEAPAVLDGLVDPDAADVAWGRCRAAISGVGTSDQLDARRPASTVRGLARAMSGRANGR